MTYAKVDASGNVLPPDVKPVIVGYFGWVKNMRGSAAPIKWCAELDGEQDAHAMLSTKRPLDKHQWGMSLLKLGAMFPCPDLSAS